MKLKTSREDLKAWLNNTKKSDKKIEDKVMSELRISRSTWTKILYVEGYCPNPQTRLLLAQFTGIEEKTLFPIIDEEKEAA